MEKLLAIAEDNEGGRIRCRLRHVIDLQSLALSDGG
jgi:hypothetical protein